MCGRTRGVPTSGRVPFARNRSGPCYTSPAFRSRCCSSWPRRHALRACPPPRRARAARSPPRRRSASWSSRPSAITSGWAWVFGTEAGPVLRQWPRAEVEKRMYALASVLQHDSFVLGRETPVPGRIGAAVRFPAEITGQGRTYVVPLVTVPRPGRPLVRGAGGPAGGDEQPTAIRHQPAIRNGLRPARRARSRWSADGERRRGARGRRHGVRGR